MKSPNCWKWTLGLCLGVSLFAGGCVKESSSASVQSGAAITAPGPEVVYQATTAEPAPSEAAPGERSAVEATPQLEAPPLTNLVEAAVEPISTNQPPPAKVKLTPAAAELVKLANSGVAETVMLAYVTNSPSTFNLGAEEIIYMNDLGVPAAVVTAMIQQDQALKAAGEAAMAASVEANTPQPPPATAQPQPADVAPQATLPATSVAETPPPPPESEVTTQVFYDSLAPYGSWVSVSGYGTCWRPTIAVVNTTWAPYCDGGRWVYTDWGWYWVSDYSWGWAPFHYGRWFRHHAWGWCWAPDTVWGPSWVAWRYNDAYCGWAPLPPGAYFTFGIGLTYRGYHCRDWDDCGIKPHYGHFVAWRDFDRHGGYRRHAVGDRERDAIYRETRVVNNTTLNNRTVINRGVPRERVAAATQRDVRPVRVRETTAMPGTRSGGRGEQLRGDTLTVYRPVIPQPSRTEGRTGDPGSRRREGGTRMWADSAPSAESSLSSRSAPGSGAPEPRTAPGQTRTGSSAVRGREQAATPPGARSAATTHETRAVPVPRQSGSGESVNNAPRPAPSMPPSRAPEAVPGRAPEMAPSRPPTGNRAPQSTRSQAPVRQEPAQTRSSDLAPRQPPAQPSPLAVTPPRTPAPAYAPPQRSSAVPSTPAPQRVETPPFAASRQPAIATQVPRYSPSQPTYNTPQAQRSYNPTPSYSRPTPSVSPSPPSYSRPTPSVSPPPPSYSRHAPSVSPAPRPSAPAAPAMAAPRPSAPQSSPPPPGSRSDSGGNPGGGRPR